jgi:RimJ/RimL family protein N-acetyltransferase
MHKLLLDIPTQFETERLMLRCYAAGDGKWYYDMSLRNKDHLRQFESMNAVMKIQSEEAAEIVVRDFANAWTARDCFFLGVFEKKTAQFVAQIFIGPINWDLPEFEIGYFVDKDVEGRGFVSEAVRGTIRFIFEHLNAERIRLECDDTNLRSCKVAERCGFVEEGHIRQNKKNADGTLSGTKLYGLIRSES